MQPPPTRRAPPLVLGIAGGSGSGKSTIARAILEALPEGQGALLQQDHYYRSQAQLPPAERAGVNYDHPEALELDLLTTHLDELRTGNPITRPTYDFTVHDRLKEGVRMAAAPVIIAEG